MKKVQMDIQPESDHVIKRNITMLDCKTMETLASSTSGGHTTIMSTTRVVPLAELYKDESNRFYSYKVKKPSEPSIYVGGKNLLTS